MAQKFANNYSTTLTGNILSTDLSLPVASVAALPAMVAGDYFFGAIVNSSNALEFFICTGIVGSTLTIPAGGRGIGGSTALNYTSGDTVRMVLIGEALQMFQQEANVAVTVTGTDVYSATYAPALRGYVTGNTYYGRVANTNTVTVPTINFNGLGAKNIVKESGALVAGEMPLNAMLRYDGTSMVLLNPVIKLTSITNSLAADVAITDTVSYFTGPSVAQGTQGTWFVSGNICVPDNLGNTQIYAKLWDGTTVIDSGQNTTSQTLPNIISLSGVITNPAGNLRISVRSVNHSGGSVAISFNGTGNSKDSTITAVRIG